MNTSLLSPTRATTAYISAALKHWLACSAIVLLAACGSQDATNSTAESSANKASLVADTPVAPVASQTTDTTVVGTSPKRDLLANLAIAYPGGVLPLVAEKHTFPCRIIKYFKSTVCHKRL